MLEKILLKKVELWIVLFLATIAIIITILFGSAVRHYYMGGDSLGSLGPVVESVAAFPGVIKKTLAFSSGKDELLAKEQRFDGVSGFHFNYPAGNRPDLGYILVNRYDGDQGHAISELWDLNLQEKVHTWSFAGIDSTWEKSTLQSKMTNIPLDAAAKRFRNFHALLDSNGNLITQAGTPLISADLCSSLAIFQGDAIYHHSIERDHAGNLWAPKIIEPKTVDIGGAKFSDDGIAQITPSGKVIFEKSVIHLLDENGLGYLVYGKGEANNDPIHLNDIEPVLKDGKFWRKGDVFLSLRHQSMVILYRPSTNKVIWYQQGPWMHQHDINVVNDHEISIFNNNAALAKNSDWIVRGTNNLLIYDFEKNAIDTPFEAGFIENEIRTKTEGRGYVIGNEVFVEETNYGRLIQFSSKGKVSWEFVNRAKDGKVYLLNWSRLISRDVGDTTRTLLSKRSCP